MFRNLPRYDELGETGVGWAPNLPSHWRLQRGKSLFFRVQREPSASEGVVTCFRDGVVTLRSRRRATGYTESLKEIGYQGIRRGDLVIHAMDAFAGAVGVSDSDGKGTPVYSVCVPRSEANPHYYAAVIREMARGSWILALSKGIRERSTDFRYEMFGAQVLPVPPTEEQAAIVKYLAHANARIDKAIAAKRRLIALVQEQGRVEVSRLVSDGDVVTGDAWFPTVRRGWSVVSLGRVIHRAVDGPHFSPTYSDAGIPFLSARNVRPGAWSFDDLKFVSEGLANEFDKRVRPQPGDVLYTKGGTTGVAKAVDLDYRFQVWVHIAVLKLKENLVIPDFLEIVLNSPGCYEQSQLETRGATNQDLGLGRMKRISLPLAPLDAQAAFVREVRSVTRRTNNVVRQAQREITLLQEFRTRLVADVVTGQVDVRAIAETLPEPPESLDNSISALDDDLKQALGECEE